MKRRGCSVGNENGDNQASDPFYRHCGGRRVRVLSAKGSEAQRAEGAERIRGGRDGGGVYLESDRARDRTVGGYGKVGLSAGVYRLLAGYPVPSSAGSRDPASAPQRNPQASFVGLDRWGKEYASFSKTLCENNAKAEGVDNVRFQRGDATALDFADGSFDAVTSNYVYHNIPGNRQEYLLETLRVLKKGGTFALHDIFSKARYGDMRAFVQKLKDMGYERVELIDTTNGQFMSKWEAIWMELSGSALLFGRK